MRLNWLNLKYLSQVFLAGLLIPLSFAPFHLPGAAILGLAFLYAQLRRDEQPFLTGFTFGLGLFGLGVSWVYVSIHQYGHLNPVLSALITLIFVVYLSLYTGVMTFLYTKIRLKSLILSCLLFSALWCLCEYLRATLLSGFPWLLLGFGQIDSPLKFFLPILGVYGVSFLTCLTAAFIATSLQVKRNERYLWVLAFVALLLTPMLLKHKHWTTIDNEPISVGIIQANLSMRDKWDETLFWKLLIHYKEAIDKLLGKDLIVMPESAIPLPADYISDFLEKINSQTRNAGSAVILGIPQLKNTGNQEEYSNSIVALGAGQGYYIKRHLVPFGEYIPRFFVNLIRWLEVPIDNQVAGPAKQQLIHVKNHPIASLICYELAYPELLRQQLPEAEWLVSVSDDGWFGHSLALYQQLQMSQVLSIQSGRYQVTSNNDGLSAIIDTEGNIIASLPAFKSGVLESVLYPVKGYTPWTYYGDTPILLFNLLLFILAVLLKLPALVRQESTQIAPELHS